jgi:Zinc finger, C3HC4 type (RING finger)
MNPHRNMNPNRVVDIRTIQIINGSDQWVPAPPDWAAAYMHHKSRPAYSQEAPSNYENRLLVYREENNCYMPTRIQCSDTGDVHPIMDCADVKVFLQDAEPVNWYPARNYQMWAFRDFIYDAARPERKFYASKYSSHLFFQRGSTNRNVTDIDLDGLPPNIIFSISRNENGSVYYERNDAHGTRVRICDHEGARAGFRGFYNRITMDPGMTPLQQPLPSYPVSSASCSIPLQLPPLISPMKTSVEEDQCILCYENAKNLTFSPCAHNIACSECYSKLMKPRECPVCKQAIESLTGHI